MRSREPRCGYFIFEIAGDGLGSRRATAPTETAPSIRRPSARNVEHRAGRERTLLRGAKGYQIGDLLDLDEAPARDLRQHVVDVLLGHLVEDRGLGDGRGHAIDRDVVAGKLLAE